MIINIILGVVGTITAGFLWSFYTAAKANHWCYKELRKKGYDDTEAKEIRAEINNNYGRFVSNTGGGGMQLRGFMDLVMKNY